MSIRKSHAILAGGLLCGLMWPSAVARARARARAAPPAVKDGKRPKPTQSVVMLAARNQAAASKELHQAVSGQLSDASVALELRWVKQFAAKPPAQLAQARAIAKGRKVVAVFWCDLTAKGEIFLYLVEPSRGRLIVRSVAKAGGGGRAESVAIIVGMSVRTLLSSLPRPRAARPREARRSRPVATVRGSRPGEASARRPVMPLTADNPLFKEAAAGIRKRKPPRGPYYLALELGYALDFYGKKSLADGVSYPPSSGAMIGLTWRAGARWAAFVSFRITEPIKAKGDTVQTSLQRYPISAGARVRFQLSQRLELAGALSFTLDYLVEDTKVPDYWPPQTVGNRLHYLIGAEARLAIRVVDRLQLLLVLGAEVNLNPDLRDYARGDQDQPIIIDPWPVQPYFRLGLSLDLI